LSSAVDKKDCTRCKQLLPLTQFSNSGRRSRCKPCEAEVARVRRAANPDRRREQSRAYRERNADKIRAASASLPSEVIRARNLWATYRLRVDDWENLYSAQNGLCSACRRPMSKAEAFVDHDHSCCEGPKSCGQCVRALLHSNCNTILGLFGNDPTALEHAADYLEYFASQHDS
jgi:hypothetical protein